MVFAKQLGLTSQESGMLFGVLPFLSFLTQVGIGMIADRWRKHKLVMMTCLFIAGVFNVLIVAVPPRPYMNVLKANGVMKCHTRLSPILTYCGDGVQASVSSANDITSGALENVDSFSPGNTNQSSTRPKALFKDDADSITSFCPRSIFGALNVLAMFANNSQANIQNLVCHVSCSTSLQVEATPGKLCLRNISNVNALSTTPSVSCNGTKQQKFLNGMYLQNLRKAKQDLDAVNESSPSENSNNDRDNCSDFHVSSLRVDGRLFDTLTCDPQQDLDCMIQCNVERDTVCLESAFSLDLTFCLVLLTQLIGTLALSPVFTLCDAACYGILKDNWREFGRQRVWGTIGWLVVSIGTSLGVYVGKGLNYALLFYVHGAMMLMSIVIAYFINMSSDICCGNIIKNTRNVIILPKVCTTAYAREHMKFQILKNQIDVCIDGPCTLSVRKALK